MTDKRPKYWFPAKKYGLGWGLPCAWQGWVVIFVFIGLVIATSVFVNPALNMTLWVICILGLSVLLVLMGLWKGEKLEWRWRKKE